MEILQAIYGLLLSAGGSLSLACLVMAGIKLREEGGINFQAGGGFFKWLFWAAIFLTLPGIPVWLRSVGVPGIPNLTPTTASYTSLIQSVLGAFVVNYLVARIVPVIAALLVFKALLDHTEGRSPMHSAIAAMFLLSVQGIYVLAHGWATNSAYATADLLWSMCSYLFTTISPIVGALCIVGAIINYIRSREWANLVFSGLGFLSIWGLWELLQTLIGVHVS